MTETLITHNTGVTLVHSLADGIVGRDDRHGWSAASPRGRLARPGTSTIGWTTPATWSARPATSSTPTPGSRRCSARLRAGLTVRNLVAPSFETAGGDAESKLERQGRAGVALTSPLGFLLALDMDLNAVRGPIGEVREFAVGTEARLLPRAYARAGLRLNTLGDEPGGHAPTFSVGGSFAAAHVRSGSTPRRPSGPRPAAAAGASPRRVGF